MQLYKGSQVQYDAKVKYLKELPPLEVMSLIAPATAVAQASPNFAPDMEDSIDMEDSVAQNQPSAIISPCPLQEQHQKPRRPDAPAPSKAARVGPLPTEQAILESSAMALRADTGGTAAISVAAPSSDGATHSGFQHPTRPVPWDPAPR